MTSAVLATGATGFIGRHLSARLRAEGETVIALMRRDSPRRFDLTCKTVAVDSTSRSDLDAALGGRSLTTIYHLAAYGVAPSDRDVATMLATNVGMASALVEVAADRGAVVVTVGSCSEYAPSIERTPRVETDALETRKLYGTSKAAGGMIAAAVANARQVPFRHLRLFNVFGPGEAAHRLLPSLVGGLVAERRIGLSAGTQVRDFLYVDDVVEAIIATGHHLRSQAGSQPTVGVLNVCSGEGRTVRNFAETVAAALSKSSAGLGFGEIAMRPDDLPFLVGDPGRMHAELSWRPRFSFTAGIEAAVRRLVKTRTE